MTGGAVEFGSVSLRACPNDARVKRCKLNTQCVTAGICRNATELQTINVSCMVQWVALHRQLHPAAEVTNP